MNEQDVAKVYETLLCSPGMNEVVKIDHKVSRKTILLMSQVISKGMGTNPGEGKDIGWLADKESIAELQSLLSNCLDKAGLTALSDKLRELHE